MLTYATIAALTAASTLIFLRRLTSWRLILRYRAGIDAIFTIALFAVFAGTLGGAVIAAMGGLILSIVLGAGQLITNLTSRTHKMLR